MAYVNIPDSNLSSSIARLVGRLQGQLKSDALTSTNLLRNQTSTDEICSDQSSLSQISSAKDNVSSSITKFKSRLDRLSKVVRPLSSAASSFEGIIKVLENIPIPQSVPPGFGIPINVTLKFVKLLETSKEFVKQLNDDIEAIELITASNSSIRSDLSRIDSNISNIDNRLRRCEELRERGEIENIRKNQLRAQINNLNTENSSFNDSIKVNTNVGEVYLRPGQDLPEGVLPIQGSVNQIRPLNREGLEALLSLEEETGQQKYSGLNVSTETTRIEEPTDNGEGNTIDDRTSASRAGFNQTDYNLRSSNITFDSNLVQNQVTPLSTNIPNFVDNNGVEYRFEIFIDPSDNIAPLRSVRAIEVITGRVALEGEKSFSSSIEVLVEELKFRIIEELN